MALHAQPLQRLSRDLRQSDRRLNFGELPVKFFGASERSVPRLFWLATLGLSPWIVVSRL